MRNGQNWTMPCTINHLQKFHNKKWVRLLFLPSYSKAHSICKTSVFWTTMTPISNHPPNQQTSPLPNNLNQVRDSWDGKDWTANHLTPNHRVSHMVQLSLNVRTPFSSAPKRRSKFHCGIWQCKTRRTSAIFCSWIFVYKSAMEWARAEWCIP